MKKPDWKKILPYAGIPVLVIALILLKYSALEHAELLLRVVLLIAGYVAAVTDLRVKQVPNQLVGILLGAWVLIIVPQLFVQIQTGLVLLISGLLGFVLSGLIFLVVYVVSHKGLGGGDVKLMAVSGLYLGFYGVLPTMLYGSVLAALTAGGLILAKKIGTKDMIPLVPFLYAGMLFTMFIR